MARLRNVQEIGGDASRRRHLSGAAFNLKNSFFLFDFWLIGESKSPYLE